MTPVATKVMTADEFFEWANRPENMDRNLELDHGKVIETPSPGDLHGTVAALFTTHLSIYAARRGHGRVACNDTGLLVEKSPDTVRGPDVMLFEKSQPLDQISRKYATEIPQLVVEVASPHDRVHATQKRIGQYLARGVPMVWHVDPEDRTIAVYRAGEIQKVLEEGDDLTGNGVLVDFQCKVADMFAPPKI